jgi:1-acyl-sn-glycerol-3-phosphate acyltransferase
VRFSPGTPGRVTTEITLFRGREAWATLQLEQVLVPKGPLGRAPAALRKPFLLATKPVPEVGLCDTTAGVSTLSTQAILDSSWLSGTLASVYGLKEDPKPEDARLLALKDHGARILGVHPRWVEESAKKDGRSILAAPKSNAFEQINVQATQHGATWQVRNDGPVTYKREALLTSWDADRKGPPGIIDDLLLALSKTFLSRVIVENPAAFESMQGSGRMFLANHQTGVESLLFVIAARSLCGHTVEALAKAEHAYTWLGRLNQVVKSLHNRVTHDLLRLGDRKSPTAMMGVMDAALTKVAENQRSLLVHAEGTRMLRAREPVTTLSSTLVDLAVSRNVPIVPVRFAGGLTVEELSERTEFPVGYGSQVVTIGEPLTAPLLRSLPPDQRRRLVIGTINALGPPLDEEQPSVPSPTLGAAFGAGKVPPVATVLVAILRALDDPTDGTRALLETLAKGQPLSAPWDSLFDAKLG